ncbi:GumC family protein [Rhodospirillum sp. A1_3_36]|uniref:GumC family protein n=1 Tax=Rhodospirillum sp. A1_3_36 TaxID=3391666 RepID=UPI0039A57927
MGPQNTSLPPTRAGYGPMGDAPPGGHGGYDLMADVKAALKALNRNRWLIFAVVGVGVIASAAFSLTLPSRYIATASVLVRDDGRTLLDQSGGDSNPFGNDILLESQTQIIRSRVVTERVIENMGLLYDPRLNPELGWKPDPKAAGGASRETMMTRVTENLRKNLHVAPVGRSKIIDISATASTPQEAADIANAVVQAYLERQVEEKVQENEALISALTERITELRKNVAAQEEKVATFRSNAGLVEGAGLQAVSAQIATLNENLTESRANLASLQAQLAEIERVLDDPDADVPTAAANSEIMSALRQQKALAMANLAGAQARYQPGHRAILSAMEVVRALTDQMRNETRSIRAELGLSVQSLQARVGSLEAALAKLKGEEGRLSDAQVELRAKERDADSARHILEDFLNRLAQVQEVRGTERADGRVVSSAIPPENRAAPNRKIIVVGGGMASLFIALLLVLWMEQTDTRLMTLEQAETWLQAPVLTLAPRLTPEQVAALPPQLNIVDKPASPYSDAIRALHLALAPPDSSEKPGIIQVTSPNRGEGKTTMAVSIGRALALEAGLRTLVVDGDRNAPMLHLATECSNDFGLVDMVRDGAELERAIQKDPTSPLHLLPMGPMQGGSMRLQDLQMRGLAQTLREKYDAVLIDSPGLLASADATAWAAISDKILLILDTGHTRQAQVTGSLRALRGLRGRLVGAVLNRADDST